jgi:FkbM family methyltransferase
MIFQLYTSIFRKIYRRVSRSLEILFFSNPYYIYPKNIYDYHNLSFSQEGEDLILKRMFEKQENGFYVDIGAHHPQRFSNTYYCYLKGWRGINIDAMPDSMKPFREIRPEDINIEAAISDSSEVLTFYIFNEPALNGFSKEISTSRDTISRYQITDTKQIRTKTLSEVLDEHLPQDTKIDFLSIDVEGLDYQVLLSNDWSKYRPKVILVEELFTVLESIPGESKTFVFLHELGYELFAKTVNTSFYTLTTT